MKVERCVFSGFKIYPQRGAMFIRSDAKTFRFLNGKCRSHFAQRHFPRKMAWTQIFRRMHKKGLESQQTRRRQRKVVKFNRGVIGATVEQIKQKRAQKKETPKPTAEAAKKAKKTSAEKKAVKKTAAPQAAVPKGKGAPKGGR
eukprot:Amastigsp_a508405_2692.p3 type:complete len:143 gc:universal Amastigsp_a508405_2692:27-455(+)